MNIFLRCADLNDNLLLFKWFNNADSFKFKIKTKNKVSFIKHTQWFAERFKDKTTFMWIIEDEKKEPLGQIRFQYSNDNFYDIDIYIIERVRQLGIATKALKKAETISNLKPLRAIVKNNNNTSYIFFDRNGYKIKSEDTKCWIFVKA